MKTAKALLVIALPFTCIYQLRAGLGNDDSWFNGQMPAAPASPPSSNYGGSGGGGSYFVPGPTKEQLEEKDLKEASDDFVDKGNKYFKLGDWEKAIAYYKKALEYNPDNDDAKGNLAKAQQRLDEMIAEKQRQENARLAQEEQERVDAYNKMVAERDQHIAGDRQIHKTQLERLMLEADNIKVPPPSIWTHLQTGIILGLFDPQDGVDLKYGAIRNPFTGHTFTKEEVQQSVFSSTDSKSASEAIRGFLDNQSIGEYTLNTEYGKKLITRLNGVKFDRLIAHSNGATIAEALIRKGIIKVDELNVAGGDRSLVNQAGYQYLIDSGAVKRIVVWVNPGDTIPIGSSLSYVTPMGCVNIAPLITSAEYAASQLMGNHQGGDAKVEYRLLKGPEYLSQSQTFHLDKTMFDAHDLAKAYMPNIESYFINHKSTL